MALMSYLASALVILGSFQLSSVFFAQSSASEGLLSIGLSVRQGAARNDG